MIHSKKLSFYILATLLPLTGCWQRADLAPVVDANWRYQRATTGQHIVQRGETLYSIAFHYETDYRQLAMINHISSPYTVKIGQRLQLSSRPAWNRKSFARPQPSRSATQPTYHPIIIQQQRIYANSRWIWPAKGRVISTFAPLQGRKGIDIAGNRGDKILAAANGVVAYAGSGLQGYGNLIIIKHDKQFLTAYGNNLRNLVHEGQSIRVGQPIAEMGVVDHRYWGVHFEIRKSGQPINPLGFLRR